VSVGRGIGVAEYGARTVPTRSIATRFLALACLLALVSLPGVAHAETTSEHLAATAREIETAAERWFEAQHEATRVEQRIADLERDIESTTARVASARRIASARVLVLYESASTRFASVIGTNAIESARRAQLIDKANERDFAVIDELVAALDDLRHQREELVAARARARKALAAVAQERVTLERRLAALRARARQESVAKTSAATASRRAPGGAPAAGTAVTTASLTAAPTRPVGADPPPPRAAAPAPPAGTGVSAHHDDPFLVCIRNRESGGNYAAVSPDGYYGAYQFLPSTWDATAVHAGRAELAGVLPSRASVFDQDEIAWALYQWQGKGPWGGRC
jgi:septal ring factor EnvC (AmiA/AmiB activator)